MPRVQDAELAAALRRRFQLKGDASIDTLAPEIVPVIVVEQLVPSDFWRDAVGSVDQPQAAALFSGVILVNPVGSGVVVETEELWCYSNNAPTAIEIRELENVGGAGFHEWRDRRLRGAPSAFLQAVTENPLTGQIIGRFTVPTGLDTFARPFKTTLYPGNDVKVINANVNQDCRVTWTWRERTRRAEDVS